MLPWYFYGFEMHGKKAAEALCLVFYDRLEEGKMIELKSVIKRDGSTVL